MKFPLVKLFCLLLLIVSSHSNGQPVLVKQAIVYSTINIIAPEDEDNQGREGGGFRNMMDGETKLTTYSKNELSKTLIKSEFMNSSIFRDNSKNQSTTIMEVMGQKMGFYSDEQEIAKMQKMRDSMANARKENRDFSNVEVEVSVTTETSKMVGYNCKKAFLITKRALGRHDTAIVWYTPEIKMQSYLAGISGGSMGMMPGLENAMKKMDKIDGFVTSYEMKMNRGRIMKMEVTKIDTKTPVEEKEFQLPKNIDIKPISEMRNLFGRMMRGNSQ
jgi:GLPGLI family protein